MSNIPKQFRRSSEKKTIAPPWANPNDVSHCSARRISLAIALVSCSLVAPISPKALANSLKTNSNKHERFLMVSPCNAEIPQGQEPIVAIGYHELGVPLSVFVSDKHIHSTEVSEATYSNTALEALRQQPFLPLSFLAPFLDQSLQSCAPPAPPCGYVTSSATTFAYRRACLSCQNSVTNAVYQMQAWAYPRLLIALLSILQPHRPTLWLGAHSCSFSMPAQSLATHIRYI